MKDLPKMRRGWSALAFAAVAAVGATAAIAGGAGIGHDLGHGHSKWQFDPAKADKQIARLVSHVLEDGTPEQKARLTEIAQSCFNDIQPIQQQMTDGHAQISRMLLVPTIDRASLDVLRSRNMQSMDQMSRRVLQAAMDAADLLTVEQRGMFNHGLHLMAMSHMRQH
ncbi:Spy/CpxP family protein refolding chaperone [Pseudoduganella sp. HUAS MS19]